MWRRSFFRRALRTAAPLVAVAVVLGCLPPIAQPSRPGPAPSSTGPASATTPRPTAAPPSDLPSPRPTFTRPTPTPRPTFFAYVVKAGDTLTSIARSHGTTARSIAFWNRTAHPSLDPDAPEYEPDRIEAGWILLLVPDSEVDPEEFT